MKLLKADGDELVLETCHDGTQRYAILSHRWLADEEEVTYADLVQKNNNIQQKAGLQKLNWCRQQAVKDGLKYIWADTVCIDKSSSQELTESINSMYRWYENAEVCYVYLHDVPDGDFDGLVAKHSRLQGLHEQQSLPRTPAVRTKQHASFGMVGEAEGRSGHHLPSSLNEVQGRASERATLFHDRSADISEAQPLLSRQNASQSYGIVAASAISTSRTLEGWSESALAKSEWFSRAWTLQELIAPRVLKFYSRNWTLIGRLQDIALTIATITGIHVDALTKQQPLSAFSIAQRMSWAAGRRSTKVEDRAYSLLGIMNVTMGIVYGEGLQAFQRLQEELLRSSSDDSIFVFGRRERFVRDQYQASALLAKSPDDFQECHDIALPSWRGECNRYQTSSKEITFQVRVLEEQTSIWWRFWRHFRRYMGEYVHRQVVLDCTLDDHRSIVLVMNLFAFPDRPSVFYVQRDNRVQGLSIYDELHKKCLSKSFTVVRNPDVPEKVFDLSTRRRKPFPNIFCEVKQSRMSLKLIHSSELGAWREQDKTLVLTERSDPLEVEFALYVDEDHMSTIYVSASYKTQGFNIKSKGRSLTLGSWTTCFLGPNSYSCVIQRVKGGFLVARQFPHKNVLGDSRIQLLQIEHIGVVSSVFHLGFRVLLSLVSFGLAVVIIVALLLLLPTSWATFGMLWANGTIKWWHFLLSMIPLACFTLLMAYSIPSAGRRQ